MNALKFTQMIRVNGKQHRWNKFSSIATSLKLVNITIYTLQRTNSKQWHSNSNTTVQNGWERVWYIWTFQKECQLETSAVWISYNTMYAYQHPVVGCLCVTVTHNESKTPFKIIFMQTHTHTCRPKRTPASLPKSYISHMLWTLYSIY